MKKFLMIVASASMLAACATNPNKISAAYVSPAQYANFDCGQIAMEQANIERRTNELYHSLKGRATGDKVATGVGVVLFWPALFFLKGNNGAENSEYARLKGEYEALRQNSVAKRCGTAFQADLSKAVTSNAPTSTPVTTYGPVRAQGGDPTARQ